MAATIKDIARQTGLSIGTISKFLNGGRVREKNRRLIERAVDELNFHVNEMARGLKTNRSKTIGMIIPSLDNYFCTHLMAYAEKYLSEYGYSVLVCNYRDDPQVEAEKIALLVNKQVDGLIIVPSGKAAAEINGLLQRGIPVVLADRLLPNVNCDAVVVNNFKIAGEAVDVFIHKGHRRVAIICGPKDVITAQERLNGYLSVHKKYGFLVDKHFIKFGDYYMDSGYRLCLELLNLTPAPTALFVTNYDMTLGAIRAVNERGLKVPEDISIIGFDDLPVFQAVKPHYSVARQPMEALGRTCARRILERLEGERPSPQVVTLEAKLLLKESVSVPP